jgi:DNA-binding transcriptional MerR regulator
MSEAEVISKQYFSIGEVSGILGVNASLIRFWETEFPALAPKKNKKGNRMFTQKDLDLLKNIYYLVKVKRFTLDGARQKLSAGGKEIDTHRRAVETLSQLRNFLQELRDAL